ncbi:hypothetical protein K1719_017828 [Acacia pycnantha]|nr:hypothetical protein K1719_017828 [Acacia pycnantha]
MACTKGSGQKAPVGIPDTMAFASREAESRFQSLKADKTLAPERGFDAEAFEQATNLECVIEIIRQREGKQINVDALIYEELFAALKSTTSNLWFPSLITELCRNTEIIFGASEERADLPSPI